MLDALPGILHNGSKMEPRGKMVTVTIKNIPEEIYEKIKLQAKANHRSVNSEIISIFEHAIQKRTPIDVEEILERARKVRELTAHYTVSEEELNRWKREGRE
jgi:plasmid stability protein